MIDYYISSLEIAAVQDKFSLNYKNMIIAGKINHFHCVVKNCFNFNLLISLLIIIKIRNLSKVYVFNVF